MSTDLKSHCSSIQLLRYSAGNSKTSVRISMKRDWKTKGERDDIDMYYDELYLTREQAAALAADLQDFAQGREIGIINSDLERDDQLDIIYQP